MLNLVICLTLRGINVHHGSWQTGFLKSYFNISKNLQHIQTGWLIKYYWKCRNMSYYPSSIPTCSSCNDKPESAKGGILSFRTLSLSLFFSSFSVSSREFAFFSILVWKENLWMFNANWSFYCSIFSAAFMYKWEILWQTFRNNLRDAEILGFCF